MAKRPRMAREEARERAVYVAGETAAATSEGVEEAGRTIREGVADAAEEARRMGDGVTAVMQCGGIMAGAAQSVSREWLEYAQGALRRNVEGMTHLARCRTFRELVDAQSGRLVEELDELMQSSRRMQQCMFDAAQDATTRMEDGGRR